MSDHLNFDSVAYKVLHFLTEEPDTRDDDSSLLVKIWSKETQADSLEEFFKELKNGNISHFESIRRIRQKIQEKNPKLRGRKWEVRHQMEAAVCQQLSFFDKW